MTVALKTFATLLSIVNDHCRITLHLEKPIIESAIGVRILSLGAKSGGTTEDMQLMLDQTMRLHLGSNFNIHDFAMTNISVDCAFTFKASYANWEELAAAAPGCWASVHVMQDSGKLEQATRDCSIGAFGAEFGDSKADLVAIYSGMCLGPNRSWFGMPSTVLTAATIREDAEELQRRRIQQQQYLWWAGYDNVGDKNDNMAANALRGIRRAYAVANWQIFPTLGLATQTAHNLVLTSSDRYKPLPPNLLPTGLAAATSALCSSIVQSTETVCTLQKKLQIYNNVAHFVGATGTSSHPTPELMARPVLAYAMLSPWLRQSVVAKEFIDGWKLRNNFSLKSSEGAVSGKVEDISIFPSSLTHASVPREITEYRERLHTALHKGIGPRLEFVLAVSSAGPETTLEDEQDKSGGPSGRLHTAAVEVVPANCQAVHLPREHALRKPSAPGSLLRKLAAERGISLQQEIDQINDEEGESSGSSSNSSAESGYLGFDLVDWSIFGDGDGSDNNRDVNHSSDEELQVTDDSDSLYELNSEDEIDDEDSGVDHAVQCKANILRQRKARRLQERDQEQLETEDNREEAVQSVRDGTVGSLCAAIARGVGAAAVALTQTVKSGQIGIHALQGGILGKWLETELFVCQRVDEKLMMLCEKSEEKVACIIYVSAISTR